MANANTATAEKPKATTNRAAPENKAADAPKEPRKVMGHTVDAKITLLANKDGTKYGTENNPKRAGSKSAGRFAQYRDGMTIDQALKAGVTTSDIVWDVNKGYIKLG